MGKGAVQEFVADVSCCSRIGGPVRTVHARSPISDRTVDLLRDGYTFADAVRARAGDLAARAVPLKLMGAPAVLIRGTAAVGFFYDTDRFRRAGAMPTVIKAPLFGRGAVHGLDDEDHRHRKQLFLHATDPARVATLVAAVDQEWTRILHGSEELNVYEAAVGIFGRAVLSWAGLDMDKAQMNERARRLATIVDGFGVPGLPWVRAMLARRDSDAWARKLVTRARTGPGLLDHTAQDPEQGTGQGSVLELVASHRDIHGRLLDAHTAGVELQNVLRPTIAVSRFAAFTALALHEHPEWVPRLRAETAQTGTTIGGPAARAFAHEVRRVYPFVPMLPARARCPLEWGGQRIRTGQRVLLDILGTNNDPVHWERPQDFDPERFLGVDATTIEHFIPQGGASPSTGHRCPGEEITVSLLAVTAAHLAQRDWTAEEPGMVFDLHRMPTRPRGGPVLRLRETHDALRPQ